MNKTIVTKDNAYIGMKVIRGRDWEWGFQNKNSEYGTIVESNVHFPTNKESFWVSVKWENGVRSAYRIGKDDKFDLYVYEKEFELPKKWCVRTGDIEVGKWFDKQCGTNCYANEFKHGYLHSENCYGVSITSLGEKRPFFYDWDIRPDYTEITIEQFKKYVMKKTSETVTLSVYQMKEIVKMAYDSWKNILREEFWEAVSNQKELVITKQRFQEYLNASIPRLWYKFKELFPEQFKPVLPDIKPGTLVYINQGDIWYMRFFSHFDEHGRLHAFNNQKKHGDTTPYNLYSLTNPLEE